MGQKERIVEALWEIHESLKALERDPPWVAALLEDVKQIKEHTAVTRALAARAVAVGERNYRDIERLEDEQILIRAEFEALKKSQANGHADS